MRRLLPLCLALLAGGFALGASLPGAGVAAAEESSADLPGLAQAGLSDEAAAAVRAYAGRAFCFCGCPHTLAGCLRTHAACKHAPRQLAMAIRLARWGMGEKELGPALDGYYASFDPSRRAKLDVQRYGPPLGSASAPVSIVEFSDFTCPFCQRLRPVLEAFVKARSDRVKLFYKPFPIAAHPRSREAALAGEWARDRGVFWAMHDRLFEGPRAPEDEDLADDARAVGGDPDDLLAAIRSGRDGARISASQAEARGAGLQGTPTLFFDGRRLDLYAPADGFEELLEATLADEEEWRVKGRWTEDGT